MKQGILAVSVLAAFSVTRCAPEPSCEELRTCPFDDARDASIDGALDAGSADRSGEGGDVAVPVFEEAGDDIDVAMPALEEAGDTGTDVSDGDRETEAGAPDGDGPAEAAIPVDDGSTVDQRDGASSDERNEISNADGASDGVGSPCTEAGLPNDPQNCGFCGHDCRGAVCGNGLCQPVVVATATSTVTAMTVRGSVLYYATSDGNISGLNLRGGPLTKVASSQPTNKLLVDGTNLYWIGNNTLYVLPDGSTNPMPVTDAAGGIHLCANSTHLFWATSSDIHRISKSGGDPELVITSPQSTSSLFSDTIAADDAYIYWSDGGAIKKAPVQPGNVVTPLVAPEAVVGILVQGSSLYFGALGAFVGLGRIPISGGDISTFVDCSPFGGGACAPFRLLSVGTSIYWIDQNDGYGNFSGVAGVFGGPLSGGTAALLASAADDRSVVSSLAADGEYVYWSNDKTIMKTTR